MNSLPRHQLRRRKRSSEAAEVKETDEGSVDSDDPDDAWSRSRRVLVDNFFARPTRSRHQAPEDGEGYYLEEDLEGDLEEAVAALRKFFLARLNRFKRGGEPSADDEEDEDELDPEELSWLLGHEYFYHDP